MPTEVSSDLASVIKFNNCLRTLKIGGSNLQSVAVVILQALCSLSSLKILDLNANQMGEDTGEFLSRLIFNNVGLNALFLNGNSIGQGVLQNFAKCHVS